MRRLLLLLLLVSCSRAKTDDPLDAKANAAREKARVPALGYAWFTADAQATGIVGERKPSVFLAASIAKTVVGTTVMQLVVQKKLSLDADVSSYVGFRVAHPKHPSITITLRLLLSHVAALADDFDELGRAGQLEPFLRVYLASPAHWADEEPGAKLRYSNAGSALAALAVEHVSGRAFADESNERIFRPLGMISTTWERRVRAVYPAADLISTAGDLARFGRAIVRGGELDGVRILPEAAVDEMLHDSLGWQHTTIGSYAVVGHEGEDRMASTGFYLDRGRGVGALALANGDAFASGDRTRATAIADLLAALLGAAASKARPARVPSSNNAD